MSREEEFISQNLNFLSRLDEFMYGYTEFMIAVDGGTLYILATSRPLTG